MTDKPEQPTSKAIQVCANWLAGCLRAGWDKSHLDELDRIWWEHHDNLGNLTPAEPIQSQAARIAELEKIADAALLVCYCPSAGGYFNGPSVEDTFERLQESFDAYYGFVMGWEQYDINVHHSEAEMRAARAALTPKEKT